MTGSDFEAWHEDTTGERLPGAEAPLKVEVVNEVRVQEFPARSLTTGQVPFGLANIPVCVVQGRPSRVGLTITARHAAGIVYLGGHDQIGPNNGYQLNTGESISLEMNGSVWAVCDTDNAGDLHWAAIHRDG